MPCQEPDYDQMFVLAKELEAQQRKVCVPRQLSPAPLSTRTLSGGHSSPYQENYGESPMALARTSHQAHDIMGYSTQIENSVQSVGHSAPNNNTAAHSPCNENSDLTVQI